LELAACDITDEVIHIIMKALHVNSSLESLDLSENLIGDDGAKSIAEALKVNYSIGELSLLCNVIEDDGAYEISSALDVNKSLRILNMNENPLSSDGVSSIVDSFGDSHLHVEVDLDQIDQIEYSMQIGDMLETNHFDRVKHLKFLLCAMLKSQSLQRFDWSLISSNIFPFIGNDCPYERE
jgi:Ran GTPase-activating protein (RanGAP) involved in mRNA processing and transport